MLIEVDVLTTVPKKFEKTGEIGNKGKIETIQITSLLR